MPDPRSEPIDELRSPIDDQWLVRLHADGTVRVNPALDRDALEHAVVALVGRIRWLTASQRGTTDHLQWPTPDRDSVRALRTTDPNLGQRHNA